MTQQLITAAKELLADMSSDPAVPQCNFISPGLALDLRAAVEEAEKLSQTDQEPVGLFLYDHVSGYTQLGAFSVEFGELMGMDEAQWKDGAVPLYAAPVAQQEASSYYVSVITTAYEQGFGKAWKGDTAKNPYAPGNGFEAWDIGYREGAMRRQQAGDNAPVAQQEAKPLSEAEVAALRSRYGWAKETIREIEAALGIGAKK